MQFWSAAPTPLTAQLEIDLASVERMVDAAVAAGMSGLFLAGTCGEGPWLPDRDRRKLVRIAVDAARGRLEIAAQVSDNSIPRIMDNIHAQAEAGATFAMISHPAVMLNATPARIVDLFEQAIEASPLPVGIYDWGDRRPFCIPEDRLKSIYLLPNVHLVKDSSNSVSRRDIALAARREKPKLRLFNGNEFRCLEYLEAGYDGCMFGGAAAIAPLMRKVAELHLAGRRREAQQEDAQMQATLHGLYGGENISCWLTGLKYYMVQKGIFSSAASYLEYPLTEECRAFIQRYARDGELISDPL